MKLINFFSSRAGKWCLLCALALLLLAVFPPALFALPFAMALGRDRQRVNVKGGGLWKTEILETGGVLAVMVDIGYMDQTNWSIDRLMQKIVDEKGNVIHVLSGGEDWTFTLILKQTSIDEINFARGDEFRHFYYQVKLSNGRYQEVYIPLAKVISTTELEFKAPNERKLSVTVQALMPKGAVTVVPAGLSVPADAYGVIVENAAPVGSVTTTNGDVYTAAA